MGSQAVLCSSRSVTTGECGMGGSAGLEPQRHLQASVAWEAVLGSNRSVTFSAPNWTTFGMNGAMRSHMGRHNESSAIHLLQQGFTGFVTCCRRDPLDS